MNNDETRMLGDRYEIGPVIGRGGMAQVRRARDTRLGRDVAIKELRIDLASDPTFQERFRREAQAAAGLNHANIVAVYDTGESTDPQTGVQVPYIVMELVEGRTLRDILRDGRKLLPVRAMELTNGVLSALAYSHRAGIVHRDIKPANVMLTTEGIVKVMDFGIARAVVDTSSTMTQTAAVIGTAQYLSPEQARGETVDARSDLYSAGCLFYELLTGQPPFTGDSPVSVAYQHVREAPTPPSQVDPELTALMDIVVLKSLAKSPDDRYQTAGAMMSDIERLLRGEAPLAQFASTPSSPGSPASSSETTAALTTAALSTAALPAQHIQNQTGYSSAVGPAGQTGALATGTLDIDAPERPTKRWLKPVLAAAIVLMIGIAAFVITMLPNGKQVSVPSVTGMTQADAEAAIKKAGLTPVVHEVQGAEDDTVGTVTGQQPEAGTMVNPEHNDQVNIDVNVGPKKMILPVNITGQDVVRATEALRKMGFTNVTSQPATTEPPGAKENEVISVTPAEGSSITAGTLITLTFATGNATVPNVASYDEAAARQALANAGFTSIKVEYQDSMVKPGTALGTNPAANTTAKKTATITIILAKSGSGGGPSTPASPSASPGD